MQFLRKNYEDIANIENVNISNNPKNKFAIIANAIASSEGFSIIGGGHLAAAAVQMGFEDNMNHISSGGGASINLLAGKELPVVSVLNEFSSKK